MIARLLHSMRERLRRRRLERLMVEQEARGLLDALGPSAYYEARSRARDEREGRMVDDGKPAGHWSAVRRRLAVLTRKDRQADSATRRLAS